MNADIYANLRLAAWRDALRVLAIQAGAMLPLTIAGAAIGGGRVAMGVLIGSAIGLIANVYVAVALLGRPLLQGKAGSVLISWMVKVVLTLSLLWIALSAQIAPPPSLIAGLFGAIVAHWLAVTFWLRKRG